MIMQNRGLVCYVYIAKIFFYIYSYFRILMKYVKRKKVFSCPSYVNVCEQTKR